MVVEVFAVNHEQNLGAAGQGCGQLCSLEAGECFTRSGGVPDVAAGFCAAEHFVVCGDVDALQDPFCCGDLVGPHDQQSAVFAKHTVPGEDVEDCVFGKESAGEPVEVGDEFVVAVCPPVCECPRVDCAFCAVVFLGAGGVRVVLGECPVGDHEHLDVVEEAAPRPQ